MWLAMAEKSQYSNPLRDHRDFGAAVTVIIACEHILVNTCVQKPIVGISTREAEAWLTAMASQVAASKFRNSLL